MKIVSRKTVKGSQNLNGPGNADLVLDEKDMEKAGKKNWLDILQENVSGFRVGNFLLGGNPLTQRVKIDRALYPFVIDNMHSNENQEWYYVNDKPIKFIIDGISIFTLLPLPGQYDPQSNYHPFPDITAFLKFYIAEDIKGIEVMTSAKYTAKYIPGQSTFGISMNDVSFVEITTRSGNGPLISNTPGTYLYKPLPLSYPKQFYKPKYVVNDTTKHLPDLRSTIDWEPNITTDKSGMATVSFYSADNPSIYTVTIEGSDGNGNLGYRSQKININKRKEIIKSK